MGLKTILSKISKRISKQEKAILRHDDALAEFLNIGVPVEQIVDKINAFDWLDISEAKTEDEMTTIIMRLFGQFNFKYPKAYELIILKAFTHKFLKAVEYLKGGIEEVAQSYNVEGSPRGFQNPTVNKFYYINYWADKKNIPVNYNDKNQENRALFNMDTIIISILADKLNLLNEFERNKVKK
jgi:hypothetical protein